MIAVESPSTCRRRTGHLPDSTASITARPPSPPACEDATGSSAPGPGRHPAVIPRNVLDTPFFPPITGPWSVSPVHISFGLAHSNRPERPLLLLRPRGRPVQLEPFEQPLQGPVRRRPPGRDLQDPPHLRRGPPRLLPLQGLRQRQHFLRGPGRGLARGRHQCVEPALLVTAPPAGQRRVRRRDPPPARPLVDTRGHLPGAPAPLRQAKPRLQELLHQRVPEQARLPGPLQPRILIRLVRGRHILSFSQACPRRPAESDRRSPCQGRGQLALNRHARTDGARPRESRESRGRRRTGTEATPP